MAIWIKNGRVADPVKEVLKAQDILIEHGKIVKMVGERDKEQWFLPFFNLHDSFLYEIEIIVCIKNVGTFNGQDKCRFVFPNDLPHMFPVPCHHVSTFGNKGFTLFPKHFLFTNR